jgi:uncharacterized protein YbjT (DUF2867 family)
MSSRKTIAVVGATGAQGGGLVRSILAEPGGEFAVRALTRNADSPAAIKLAAAGAEVVVADVDDESSLARAFDGAYGAYCVTFYWDHFSPEREQAQAAAMARAARRAGLSHVIWSTLEDTRRFIPLDDARMPALLGRYKVPHFDAKGESDRFFTDLGLPVTFLLTSFYWDNFINFGMAPRRDAGGVLTLTIPMADKKLPGIAAEDIGRCAHGIFKRGAALQGEYVGAAGEHLTGAEMARAFELALGQPVKYHAVEPAVYRGFGFPGAEDLGNMFQFKQEFSEEFCLPRDPAVARSLNPDLQDFATWLGRNKSRIPIG